MPHIVTEKIDFHFCNNEVILKPRAYEDSMDNAMNKMPRHFY